MNPEIIAYYDRLAPKYDNDRFANSYGRFIDAREREILQAWLPRNAIALELGCGTGRLSSFATIATDASIPSLAIAQSQRRKSTFIAADAENLPFPGSTFDTVFAFHVFMHLERGAIRTILQESARVLRPGGTLIADVVSKTRRNITGTQREVQTAWHGATAMTPREFEAECAAAGFRRRRITGLLTLPIHRLPHRTRAPLAHLDAWLSQAAPSLSSYLVGSFEKR